MLGIRPEHLYRYDADLKARRPALAQARATVDLVEPTGAETIVMLKLGNSDIVGRFEADSAPQVGEAFSLGIDMAHACLFDPTTERLIPDAIS